MKRINLALQGGGAHGAFTWGVLDRLLETTRSRSRRYPAPRRAR
jgi:predicted acylesterase/phospholipase RssA